MARAIYKPLEFGAVINYDTVSETIKGIIMLAWLVLLVGCRNPCQNLCLDIRDFAEEECGITVPEEQVKSCLKEQRQVEREQAKSCMGAAPSLEEEWECDDVEVYFNESPSAADTGS